MTDDLDTLRPEIREAVAAIDKGNGVFVNGDDCDGGIAWATARAELLRLQSTESRANEWQLRAERAEGELAALKARIAGGELGVVAGPMKYSQAPVIFAEPDRAMALIGQRVALVKVED